MRLHICLAFSLFVSTFAAVAPARSDEDDVLRFFDDVVFAGKDSARVVKWSKAPTVRLETLARDAESGEPKRVANDPRLYRSLMQTVRSLSDASGLQIRLLPDGIADGGDVVIRLMPVTLFSTLSFDGVPRQVLRQQIGPGRCFFLIWPNRDWGISKARIVINNVLSERHITHCFIEELTQSMGLPNDSDRLRPSVFNESRMLPDLSDLDRTLVGTLYDPSIVPGMTRRAALERVEKMLERISDR